jgi:benzaldehyde dehydrogenase (NAD)
MLTADGWKVGASVLAVIEKATSESLGVPGQASAEDVSVAAVRAAEAQQSWATASYEYRASVLRAAGQAWLDHADEVNDWIVREAGSIPPKAPLETHTAAQECFEAAALASHPSGDVLPSSEPRWSLARRIPVGVVAVIAPFNFPVILAIRSVAPALVVGNAVLLKPDPRTAVCGGVAIARIFEEAGLPPGLLQLLPEHLTRAHLELGGNNALIVLPGADLALATPAGAFGSFMHQGQI